MIVKITQDNIAVTIEAHTIGVAHLPLLGTMRTKLANELAVGREHLDAIIVVVGNDVAILEILDAIGGIRELSVTVALCSKVSNEATRRRKDLHSSVALFHYNYVAFIIDCNSCINHESVSQ